MTGAGKKSGNSSRERLETLTASFKSKCAGGYEATAEIAMTLEAGTLSAEEFGPLITLLAQDENAGKAVELLAVRWAMLDPEAALAFALDRTAFQANGGIMASIVGELAKINLPAAKAALPKLETDARWVAERAMVRTLQRKDLREALAYARGMDDDDVKAEVLTVMAEKEPLAAAAELTSGKEGQQLRVVQAIAGALLLKDRTVFEEWMQSLTDPEQGVAALSIALSGKFQPDPKNAALEAAAWLAGRPEVSGEAATLTQDIAACWLEAKGQPGDVAAWALSLPEGPARDVVVYQVARGWVAKDAAAASAWMATLPQGKGRDNAVHILVGRITGEAPEDAFEWARTVGDPSLRYETLKSTLSNWAAKDSAAAQAAVERLPAGDRGYLLEALKERERAGAKERK